MSGPLVSVVMPCYNAAKYLGEAMRSVLEQTYHNLELIVVDSGSADDSWEVIQSFAKDQRIRPLRLERSAVLNAAATRNRGLSAARGEYVKFVDADDIVHREMVQQQIQRLQGRNDCVASSEWGRFYHDDLSSYRPSWQSVWRDMDAREWLVESWMDARPMMQCGMFLIPRALLEKTGGWDERLTLIDDFEFFTRLFTEAREVLFTLGCPVYYRSGVAGSLSRTKGTKAVESAFLSINLGTDHLLAKRSDAKARLACANMLQDFAYNYYPTFVHLVEEAECRARSLREASIEPAGGRKFQWLRRILGWRMARRIAG